MSMCLSKALISQDIAFRHRASFIAVEEHVGSNGMNEAVSANG